jgi:hypothetical protein
MKYLTILFTVIVSFCIGVLVGRYYLTEKAPIDKAREAVHGETSMGFTRSVPNQGPVRPGPGHGALSPAIAQQAERMEEYGATVVRDAELQKQEMDMIMNNPQMLISTEHTPSDASQLQSEPTPYELRRDYEIALLDSGVSRAEAAYAADSFFEYINLVNEMVENDLREWHERVSNEFGVQPLEN